MLSNYFSIDWLYSYFINLLSNFSLVLIYNFLFLCVFLFFFFIFYYGFNKTIIPNENDVKCKNLLWSWPTGSFVCHTNHSFVTEKAEKKQKKSKREHNLKWHLLTQNQQVFHFNFHFHFYFYFYFHFSIPLEQFEKSTIFLFFFQHFISNKTTMSVFY